MKVSIGNPSVNVGIDPKSVGINTGSQIARYVVEPYVAVEETEDGAVITCTAQGETTTGTIYNGADGKDGKDGKTGETPDIFTIATTLPAGSSAYAHTSGTLEQPLITFGIPKGDKGDPGTTDYTDVTNKPQINSVTLSGNKTSADLGLYEKPAGGIPAADLADKYAAADAANGAAYRSVSIPYGEVDSTSTNTAYTVTVPGITELRDGVCCYVRNDVVTGTTGCTINVNNLGAKPMYASNADETRVTSAFSAASTWLLIYNEKRVEGGCWDVYYGSVNSNTIGYQLRVNSFTLPLATYCGRYRLLFTSADGTKFVPANADTQTSAAKTHTVSTTPIDPFGEIFYYGSTSVKQANELPAASVLWQQYVITLGYSFNSANAALTLTVNKPVYITATPQSDGSAVLDYFTQDRPTTQDGKIYIYLGVATAATTVEMTMKHPIYYHDGTRCRIWNGDPAAFNL